MTSGAPTDRDDTAAALEETEVAASTGPTDDPKADRLRQLLGMDSRRRPAVLAPGQVVDEAYRIERELGAGGMGVVYLARDLRLHRDVAIKLHAAATGPSHERLMREAASMAQLRHPHVVTVYEVGTWAGHPYVAMEYVAGGTLRSWLARPRAPREILGVFVSAARGLAAAHAAGLVHRDFKPDNVLVGDDGRILVADFGLARGFGDDLVTATAEGSPQRLELTQTGAVVGTPAYMAPEQRRTGPVGPAADQFAFAVALWEALFGQRPFPGDTAAAIAASIERGELRAPPRRAPRRVHRALIRALSAEPARRWPSMAALIDELTVAPSRKLAWAVGATVGLGAVAVGAIALRRDDPPAAVAPAPAGEDPNRALLANARAALQNEPAEALAWLARLDPRAQGMSAARVIAAEALTRPRLRLLVEGLPRDGNLLVSRDRRHAIVKGETETAVVELDTGAVRTLAGWNVTDLVPMFCDDGRSMVALATSTAGVDAHVRIDLATGGVEPAGGDDVFSAVAACSAALRIARSDDRHLLVWNAATGRMEQDGEREIVDAFPMMDGVHGLVFTETTMERWTEGARTSVVRIPDDFRLSATSHDQRWVLVAEAELAVLDAITGERRRLAGPATAATISPDGARVVAAFGPHVEVFDVATRARIQQFEGGAVDELVISPDGRFLLLVGERISVRSLDRDGMSQVIATQRAGWSAHSMTDNLQTSLGTDDVLVLDNTTHRLRAWALDDVEAIASSDETITSVAWSPDGRWLATAGLVGLVVRDQIGGLPAEIASELVHVSSLVIDDAGDVVFARTGGAVGWRRRGAAAVELAEGSRYGRSAVAWSTDGVPVSWDGQALTVWEPSGPVTIPVAEPGDPDTSSRSLPSPVVAPVGTLAVARCVECQVRLVDPAARRARTVEGAVGAMTFTRDGASLVSTQAGGGVAAWDVATLRPTPLGGPSFVALAAAADPAADRVALAGEAVVVVVDLHTGEVRTFPWVGEPVVELAFPPGGAELVARLQYGDLVLWDLASSERRIVPSGAVGMRAATDAMLVVGPHRLVSIEDDLPRDPDALVAHLRALPYAIDDAGRLTVRTATRTR